MHPKKRVLQKQITYWANYPSRPQESETQWKATTAKDVSEEQPECFVTMRKRRAADHHEILVVYQACSAFQRVGTRATATTKNESPKFRTCSHLFIARPPDIHNGWFAFLIVL